MAKFAPHYNLFKTIGRINSFNHWLFWLILILSMIPLTPKEYYDTNGILNYINILNIIGIALFFILDIIVEYILTPQADSKRRDDFIDNSFGSGFAPDNSIEYYDNEELSKGLYKAATNLFENCFFTYSLVKATLSHKIIIPAIVLVLISVFAYFGFKEVPFVLSVLQALFSANILGGLIKHLILLTRLSVIQDSWIALFQQTDLKASTHIYQAFIYRYWLQYETLHSKISAETPEKVYIRLNPSLTEEWKKLKAKYDIY